MLWVDMEVNSDAVKHLVELNLSVGEVYNTTLTHMRGVVRFWHAQTAQSSGLDRRLVLVA